MNQDRIPPLFHPSSFIVHPFFDEMEFNMKRILFALLCVACTGTAWAQTPNSTVPTQPGTTVLSVQKATAPVYDVRAIQPVSGGRFSGHACGASDCAPICSTTPTKTICVPVPATKVDVKINYSRICGKVCFPKCTPFSHGCNSCDHGQCECHAWQQNYLVKRVTITECPITKCVPVCVPVCETGRCGVHCPAPGKVETIQAPKKK
jgi:hypothetical protein